MCIKFATNAIVISDHLNSFGMIWEQPDKLTHLERHIFILNMCKSVNKFKSNFCTRTSFPGAFNVGQQKNDLRFILNISNYKKFILFQKFNNTLSLAAKLEMCSTGVLYYFIFFKLITNICFLHI